jgi:large subunit ribosomal protein L31
MEHRSTMKAEIHPQYHQAQVHCVCGNEFTVGSTTELIRVEVCNKCHPFFTGTQNIVDTAGQVERFQKRLERSQR